MAKYTVYASETVYESCTVEADSPEEAILLARKGWCSWKIDDGDDFNIERAELEKEIK